VLVGLPQWVGGIAILYIIRITFFKFQVACFELPRVRSFNFGFRQVQHGTSVWNRPVRSQNVKFCSNFLQILFLWSRMDAMYFTRQSPIGSYRLLGGNMLIRGILTRGIFWSDGLRLPSFDRTATQYAKFEKKVTNWAGICWHLACWHVADFDRTVHVYRAGTCHVEMINCEKIRLPRQICNFCVSAVSRMESRFFVSRKCFFLHLPLQAARLLGLRFRAPNGINGRTPGEVPTGVGRTFELLIGRSKGLSNKIPK
jgi:hypothetical protein